MKDSQLCCRNKHVAALPHLRCHTMAHNSDCKGGRTGPTGRAAEPRRTGRVYKPQIFTVDYRGTSSGATGRHQNAKAEKHEIHTVSWHMSISWHVRLTLMTDYGKPHPSTTRCNNSFTCFFLITPSLLKIDQKRVTLLWYIPLSDDVIILWISAPQCEIGDAAEPRHIPCVPWGLCRGSAVMSVFFSRGFAATCSCVRYICICVYVYPLRSTRFLLRLCRLQLRCRDECAVTSPHLYVTECYICIAYFIFLCFDKVFVAAMPQ